MSPRPPLSRGTALILAPLLAFLILPGCGEEPEAQSPPAQGPPLCFAFGTTLAAPGCPVVATDDSADPDPRGLWHSIECERASRHSAFGSGGDWHPTASGESPSEDSFRRLTVFDGDRFSGERCELGRNSHLPEDPTFQLYREGDRRITFASFRVGRDFPREAENFQVVMQMKQSQPADAGGGSPVLSLQIRRGRWELEHVDRRGQPSLLWSARVEPGTWSRFALDVEYSRSAQRGSVRLSADTNGTGTAGPGERTPRIRLATLRRETAGDSSDGVRAGQSVPSHLRVGIYHFPRIACPRRTGGCSVDVDNIEVVDPHGLVP